MSAASRSFLPQQALLAWCLLAPSVRSQPALVGDNRVDVSCASLGPEASAEIVARIRASLLSLSQSDARVVISCGPQAASVEVALGGAQATQQVASHSEGLREELVLAFDELLRQLTLEPVAAPRPAAGATARTVEPAPPTASPPAAPIHLPRREARSVVSPSSSPSAQAAQLSALAVTEAWHDDLALGGSLGLLYGSEQLAFGVALAALHALTPARSFEADEFSAALSVMWQPAGAVGLRGLVATGPSLLWLRPTSDFAPQGPTTINAWFVEATMARPFWLGRVAILPQLGARVFSGLRYVNVDTNAALRLGGVTPRIALGLLYVVD